MVTWTWFKDGTIERDSTIIASGKYVFDRGELWKIMHKHDGISVPRWIPRERRKAANG